jgi:hypothetical protein
MNTAESRAEAACVTGGTELHLAARTGDVARAAYLLEVCDADVNAYDRWYVDLSRPREPLSLAY